MPTGSDRPLTIATIATAGMNIENTIKAHVLSRVGL
jgi:hypothetical protein